MWMWFSIQRSPISETALIYGRFPELGSLLPSGKRATCRWRKIRSIVEMVFTGADRSTRRESWSSATLSTTNLTLNGLESKPSLRDERPERNRLRHFLALET
jgi:hypothetical protein